MTEESRRRAKEIFQSAVDLTPAEREPFVRGACGDDKVVEAEVRSLLAAGGAVGTFLAVPAGDDPEAGGDIPERVGRYQILRRIGEGGMGVVYEAQQENPRRTVALKLVRLDFVSHALLRRFDHEVSILGRLAHPGIARIYEAGAAEVHFAPREPARVGRLKLENQPFFAMELVRGETIIAYADQESLGTAGRMELFVQVCEAVHYAHTQGIIHRDLKPGNILVDELGQPKILDFGVARLTNREMETLSLRTGVGQLIGTLPYMSPEQVAGDPDQLDARSDVYTLGVILFELLAGRQPYDLSSCSLPEAARAIREEEPSRLSSINPALRGDIETIVGKALEKERQRRYVSAEELAADIRRYLADQPIHARPVSAWYQLRKFSRRNRGLVLGASAAVIFLVVGSVVSTGLAIYALRQRGVAEQRSSDLARQAYRAGIAAASAALRNSDIRLAQTHLGAAPAELRGWEWEYLNSISNRSLRTFEPRAGWIQLLALSDDGERVVTGTREGEIRVWEFSSGRTLGQFRIPVSGRLGWAAISHDGKRLFVTHDATNEHVLWDVDRGQALWKLPAPADADGGAISPDGGTIALPALPGAAIELVDAETGQTKRSFTAPAPVLGVHFSASGTRLHTLERTGFSRVIELADGASQFEIGSWSFVFDRELTRCLVHDSHSQLLKLCALPGRDPIAQRPMPFAGWPQFHFFDDGRAILALESSGTISVWDQRLERVTGFVGPPGAVLSRLSPDQRRLVTATADGTIQDWDARTIEAPLLVAVRYPGASVCAAAASGATLLGGWGDVQRFDARTGAPCWSRFVGRKFVTAVCIDADGKHVAAAEFGGAIHLLNGESGVLERRIEPLASTPYALRWLGASRLAAGLRDGRLAIVELETGTATYCDGHRSAVQCMALNADASLLATGSGTGAENGNFRQSTPEPGDNRVIIWDPTNWTALQRLDGHTRPVTGMAFHPDRVQLATCGMDGAVRIWNARTGARIAAVENVGEARALAFSPDGQRLAAVCSDGIVRVWHMHNLEELMAERTAATRCTAAGFSTDGRMLLAAGGDTAVLALETGSAENTEERFRATWANRYLASRPNELSEDLRREIESDSALPPDVRETALRFVQVRGDHANILNSEALIESRRTEDHSHWLAIARRKIEAALRVLPDDSGFLATYGGILCESGSFAEALDVLARSDARYDARGAAPPPANWAYQAIARHGLGQLAEARQALERFRRALPSDPTALDPDEQRLLNQAEQVLGVQR